MSNRGYRTHRSRAAAVGGGLILVVTGAMAACAGETPAAPHPASQAVTLVASDPNFSFSISPADRTVRVRFNRVRSDGVESVSAFMQRMFASADSAGATRLVVDLRSIADGDSFLLVPLVKGVLARDRFATHGGLLLVVGDRSFSSKQNAARLLDEYANPILVTEMP